MYSVTKDQMAAALAAFVQERLSDGKSVRIPGLGTISVVHKPSQVEERADGEVVIRPPRDMVAFRPD